MVRLFLTFSSFTLYAQMGKYVIGLYCFLVGKRFVKGKTIISRPGLAQDLARASAAYL